MIHETAVVAPEAKLGEGVQVGPFCVVGPSVELGAGTVLEPHAVVTGRTTIGEGTHVGSFAVLGGAPQHSRHEGVPGTLRIGPRSTLREHVTVHSGSSMGGMATTLGEECILMVGAHVAHDCHVGDRCTLVNGVMLGGHVEVGDDCFVGGATTVHQYVRLGDCSYVGGSSAVERDVVPWGLALGNRATLRGPNLLGMKRRGLDRDTMRQGQVVFAELFAGAGAGERQPLTVRVAALRARGAWGEVGEAVLSFLEGASRRGVLGTQLSGTPQDEENGEG